MKRLFYALIVFGLSIVCCPNCGGSTPVASTTGVQKATATVEVNSKGLTVEQENIKSRYAEDNTPGAIKHLYVISAMSGQVIIYSTVKGKVTSSGKRLSPYSVASAGDQPDGFDMIIGGQQVNTEEVLQDDGTYGSSEPYIFWWDTKGVYHQHYISGGQIVHVSNKPLSVKSVMINVSN